MTTAITLLRTYNSYLDPFAQERTSDQGPVLDGQQIPVQHPGDCSAEPSEHHRQSDYNKTAL